MIYKWPRSLHLAPSYLFISFHIKYIFKMLFSSHTHTSPCWIRQGRQQMITPKCLSLQQLLPLRTSRRLECCALLLATIGDESYCPDRWQLSFFRSQKLYCSTNVNYLNILDHGRGIMLSIIVFYKGKSGNNTCKFPLNSALSIWYYPDIILKRPHTTNLLVIITQEWCPIHYTVLWGQTIWQGR